MDDSFTKTSLDSGMFVELAGDCTGNLLENCTFDNITFYQVMPVFTILKEVIQLLKIVILQILIPVLVF